MTNREGREGKVKGGMGLSRLLRRSSIRGGKKKWETKSWGGKVWEKEDIKKKMRVEGRKGETRSEAVETAHKKTRGEDDRVDHLWVWGGGGGVWGGLRGGVGFYSHLARGGDRKKNNQEPDTAATEGIKK